MNHQLSQRLEKRSLTVKRVYSVLWRRGFVRCIRVTLNNRIVSDWRPMDHEFMFAHDSRVEFTYRRRGAV